jgi:hypothetical protein
LDNKSLIMFIIMVLVLAPLLGLCEAAAPTEFSLAITPALNSVPADGGQHPSFFVSVTDNTGKPRILNSPVNVTLSSSDERILKVPGSVVIEAKKYYAVVEASSKILEKKSVEVSASSSGFQSAKATINVEPPAGTPYSLKVTLLPNVLAPSVGAEADVVVTVVDVYGNPAKARSDLDVALASSNLRIADVIPSSMKIFRGDFSTKFKVKTTGFVGTTSITASCSDLKPDSAVLSVNGPKPERLYIWFPSYITLNETGYLPVMVTDKDMRPAKLPFEVKVSLFSSNTSVLSVQNDVTIKVENWYTLAKITSSKNITGFATIYASAENMTTASTKITVVRSVGAPKSLKVYSFAKYFPADGLSYTGLIVQSVNASNYPCYVNASTTVNLFSSTSEIIEVPSTLRIQRNSSMVYGEVLPNRPGDVKVTVAATNFEGSQASFSVYEATPSSLQVIVSPIPSGGEVLGCLLLSSSAGVPAPVQQDTEVTLASSNTKVSEVDSATVLQKKGYYTLFKIRGKTPGSFLLSASGSGVPSVSTSLTVREVRPSKFFVLTTKTLAGTEFPLVAQIISSAGPPAVLDEAVTIKIASSNVSSAYVPESRTIRADTSEVLLFGKALSTSKFSVTISSEGFTSATIQITPQSYKSSLKIFVDKTAVAGTDISVKALVSLDGKPAEGVTITWNGTGLRYASSDTMSDGTSMNTLTVQRGENLIKAYATVPGSGYVANYTKMVGLAEYTLDVSTNVDASIDVSPSGLKYREGMKAIFTAPSSVSMGGLLGLLGGKYNFKQWSGYTDSKQNPIEITFAGDNFRVTMRALYEEDYTMALVWIVVLIIIVAVVAFFLIRRWKASKAPPPVEEESEGLITVPESAFKPEPKPEPQKPTPEVEKPSAEQVSEPAKEQEESKEPK